MAYDARAAIGDDVLDSLNPDPKGLVPCGGKGEKPCTPCDVLTLGQNLLNFIWWRLSIPLATLMLAYGGLLMIVPGFGGEKSANTIEKGKKVLWNTVMGIAIIFFAWLAIDTIIKLVSQQSLGEGKTANLFPTEKFGPWNKLDCKAVGPSLTPGQTGQVPPISPSAISFSERQRRDDLKLSGIEVNKNPCPEGKSFGQVTGGCTNVACLPDLAISRIKSINSTCGGNLQITGGCELGHTSHGPGKPIVDIGFNQTIAECVKKNLDKNPASFGIKRVCSHLPEYKHECNTPEKQPHLHIEFN